MKIDLHPKRQQDNLCFFFFPLHTNVLANFVSDENGPVSQQNDGNINSFSWILISGKQKSYKTLHFGLLMQSSPDFENILSARLRERKKEGMKESFKSNDYWIQNRTDYFMSTNMLPTCMYFLIIKITFFSMSALKCSCWCLFINSAQWRIFPHFFMWFYWVFSEKEKPSNYNTFISVLQYVGLSHWWHT